MERLPANTFHDNRYPATPCLVADPALHHDPATLLTDSSSQEPHGINGLQRTNIGPAWPARIWAISLAKTSRPTCERRRAGRNLLRLLQDHSVDDTTIRN